jgi:zinc D-Ala-D-Ala carboxypeptidase
MSTPADVRNWLSEMAKGYLDLSADSAALAALALDMLRSTPAPAPEPELPAGYLTEHFLLAEFTRSDTAQAQGIDNTPDETELAEIQATAELLEAIRALLGGHPVTISSGFRCPSLNAAVGGASDSAHLYGAAADFEVPEFGTPLEICKALEPRLGELQIDQLIHENDSWVHVGRAIHGAAPRCQCLTISGGQTMTGFA